jgi:flagellar hook-length control protein FliK
VVIQLSPHTETAQVCLAQASGAESPQKPEPQNSHDKTETGGVFAKILAGLLRKTGNAETENTSGEGVSGDGLSLAEMAGSDETLPVAGKGKNSRSGKIQPETEPAASGTEKIKAGKKGGNDEDIAGTELADAEKNILLAVDRLISPAAGTGPLTEAENDALNAEMQAVDVPAGEGFPVDTGALLADIGRLDRAGTAETAGMLEAAELIRSQSGEVPKTDNEKPKVKHRQFAEASPGLDPAALEQQRAGEGLLERAALKKAAFGGEKENRGRLDEARSRDRRRGVSFEVRDFRTAAAQTESAVKMDQVQFRTGAETHLPLEDGPREITLELHLPNQGQDAPLAETTWEGKASRAFEDLLARELHQNFNNDIVRHASMAVRDGGEGTIRLALKPESLGNVKIRLEMAENKIIGQITVETEEALRAFEREIHSLEQAFKDSGFEGANLEMSLAADSRGADQHWRDAETSQFLQGELAASRYDAAVERIEAPAAVDIYQRTAAINVLV